MMRDVLAAAVCVAAAGVVAADLTVDFSRDGGRLKPAIHSSGWAPRSYPRSINNDDAAIRSMNLTYARTHDWALVNSGQRVVDYQNIFPLFDKDVKDPTNYCFEPTDHLLSLSRNVGLKLFYRLGTSIEHTGKDVHFNARVPKDFDKTAEIFASIVRHYNRGWAKGFEWGIKYWEIWNEPDGLDNMWWLPASEGGTDEGVMMNHFIRLYVTVLRRLKSEFPEIKVGGPALCSFQEAYFRPLLRACKEAGVQPDFISWHYYGYDPDALLDTVYAARRLCDEFGFTKTELIINEYHYLLTWDGIHGRNSTPAMVKRAYDGPTGHNNIDSACFYLTMLSLFQTAPLDQAYYYGCAHQGNWGYMNQYKQFNKPYYAACLFGGVLRDYPRLCEVGHEGRYTLLAAKSEDGKGAALLLVDYRGTDQVLSVRVNGIPAPRRVSTVVLDDARDNFPCEMSYGDGVMTLLKPDKNSAAFLVKFDLD